MTNFELAKKYKSYIIEKRRYFHMYPENTGNEFNTVRTLLEELHELDIPCVEIENGGILAWIRGDEDNGRSVLLRADIDALPVQESDDNLLPGKRTCKSLNEGVMHACGHDAHIAMLLGAIKVLMEKRSEIKGTIYIVFERGEEYPDNFWQILEYMDKNHICPDTSWAIHVFAGLETGKLSIADGSVMASSIPFTVTLQGRGGHGSRPDQAVNPIDAFCAIYTALSSFRMRRVNPFVGFTCSIGKVVAGDIGNVIPDTLTFQGSVRTLDREVAGKDFITEFEKFVSTIAEAYGCTAEMKPLSSSFPVANSPVCAEFAREHIAAELGKECLCQAEPWMATETFANYLKLWPGVFAFLGIANPEKGCGAAHHNPAFDIDEDALVVGTAAAVTYALEYLNSDLDVSGEKTFACLRDLLWEKGDARRLKEMFGEEFVR